MNSTLRKYLVVGGLLLLIVPLLAACGGPQTVDVELTEDYQIILSTDTVKAGEVTFNITNTATELEHEFVIVQTDLAPSAFPLDSEGDVTEDDVNIVDEQEAITAGSDGSLTVTLDPGHYVLMCNLPGHFSQGMHAEFTVTQ